MQKIKLFENFENSSTQEQGQDNDTIYVTVIYGGDYEDKYSRNIYVGYDLAKAKIAHTLLPSPGNNRKNDIYSVMVECWVNGTNTQDIDIL